MKTAEDIALEVNKTIMTRLTESPTLRLIDLDSLTDEEIKGYLQSRHSTSWGSTFTVTSEDTAQKAVDWLRVQLDGLHEFLASLRKF